MNLTEEKSNFLDAFLLAEKSMNEIREKVAHGKFSDAQVNLRNLQYEANCCLIHAMKIEGLEREQ